MRSRMRGLATGVMVVAALTLISGCSGSSREQTVATPVLGTIQVSVVASGPATMVFQATGAYQLLLSHTTDGNGTKSNQVTPAGNVLTAGPITLADVAPGQFLLDIVSNSDAAGAATTTISKPLFKTCFVQKVGQGQVVPVRVTIGATDTAKAFAYASWPKAKSKTIDQFQPDAASLSFLVATMSKHLQKSSGNISCTFKWNPGIGSLAADLGKATP